MALITISGYPCSGKTRRAEQIKSDIEKRMQNPSYAGPQFKVVHLSDDSLALSRHAYNESQSEKPARAALFTAMQRQMGQDTILIIDSLNYIKGFRYQMYCAARELKLRVCTVYVIAPPQLCREWNNARPDGQKYPTETLEALLLRFEEPSSMVRWDSPLFTIPWSEEAIPNEDIWQAVSAGNVKPPNAGTQAVPKPPSDALHTLERTSASMVSALMAEQAISQGLWGGPKMLSISPTLKVRVATPARNITLSELQRLKRQFVTVHKKAITLGTTEQGAVDWSEESIATKFATYLEENLKT